MEMMVSMGMLVFVLAWVARVYSRLHFMRNEVVDAWLQWQQATHRRNEQLSDFALTCSGVLAQNAELAGQLRQMVEESEQLLRALKEPCWGCITANELHGGESRLLRAARQSVCAVEQEPRMQEHPELLQLCGLMSMALHRQEQRTRYFNRAAREYNAALASPGGHMLAPVFGFLPVGSLSGFASEYPEESS